MNETDCVKDVANNYSSFTATYSPEDNKLRLSATTRLDKVLYERVRDSGFIWAPKQEIFVAPMWTPERADLMLELAGEIGDEDTSLADRAEDRAERFADYSETRAADAHRAHAAVAAITDHIPMGQPILVGHHSERRARKDAQRIENGMRKAVDLWETSKYWEHRAARAIHAAKYKERPDVRVRRIKTIEADKRKQERCIAEAEKFLSAYLDPQMQTATLKYGRNLIVALLNSFGGGLSYEDQTRLEREELTLDAARDLAISHLSDTVAWLKRWIAHYNNRLTYERAMLSASGGIAADRFAIEVGGRVLVRGDWVVVTRVNKSQGAISSVRTNALFVPVRNIEEIEDYSPPAPGDAEMVKAATKLAPLVNFPGEGFLNMTKAEWAGTHSEYKGTHHVEANAEHGAYRYRSALTSSGRLGARTAPVYITDAKRVDPPPPTKTAPVVLPVERGLTVSGELPAKPSDAEPNKFDVLAEHLKQGVQTVVAAELFPTPSELAARVVAIAEIQTGQTVLEPSAGTGALLDAIRSAGLATVQTAVEINYDLVSRLRRRFDDVRHADFLECSGELGTFDKIVMNPPFGDGVDILHIKHALKYLKPGGRLVAICANGPRQQAQLRPMANEWHELPPGSFKAVGTNVNTAICVFHG